jgi:hypothetical protein
MPQNIIKVKKPRTIRQARQVARMGAIRNAYFLVGKPEMGKGSSSRTGRTWEDNIKTRLKEITCESVDCRPLQLI